MPDSTRAGEGLRQGQAKQGKLFPCLIAGFRFMIVSNAQRTTAIVIRHDGQQVRLVPMKPGRLTVCRTTREKFDAEWQVSDHPLPEALASFLEHARQQGATLEAQKGLDTLARRDDRVVAPLF